MKLRYKISHLAKIDIEEIWYYTFENWSIEQANQYYQKLFFSINTICENPKIGKSIEHIKKQHRILQIQSHLIIYKIEKDMIWIDRILHKSMDITDKLEE
jgi:toxin ParE1/3/4